MLLLLRQLCVRMCAKGDLLKVVHIRGNGFAESQNEYFPLSLTLLISHTLLLSQGTVTINPYPQFHQSNITHNNTHNAIQSLHHTHLQTRHPVITIR